MPTAIRDAEATRERLLAAASDEFARHGVAGARVDRIAQAAGANKQLIYAYFNSKDGLFNAVLARHCGALAEAVPFDAEDMPGYVGRLFDYALEHPEVYRLVSWAALERPEAIADFERDSYGAKLDAITTAQKAGRVDASFAPADLLALLMAIASAWFSASEAIRRFDSKDPMSPRRLAQFRQAAIESASRMLSPTGHLNPRVRLTEAPDSQGSRSAVIAGDEARRAPFYPGAPTVSMPSGVLPPGRRDVPELS